MNRLAITLVITAAIAITGFRARAEDVAAGKAAAQRWCASCHLINGGGAARDAAPPFAALAREPALTSDRLNALLMRPHGDMAGMSFTRQDIDDLVAYIESLRLNR